LVPQPHHCGSELASAISLLWSPSLRTPSSPPPLSVRCLWFSAVFYELTRHSTPLGFALGVHESCRSRSRHLGRTCVARCLLFLRSLSQRFNRLHRQERDAELDGPPSCIALPSPNRPASSSPRPFQLGRPSPSPCLCDWSSAVPARQPILPRSRPPKKFPEAYTTWTQTQTWKSRAPTVASPGPLRMGGC
jgi:hypothetical protein